MNSAQTICAIACIALFAPSALGQQEKSKSEAIDKTKKETTQREPLPSHLPPITPLVPKDDRDQGAGDTTDGETIPPNQGWLGPRPEDIVYFREIAFPPPGAVLIQETQHPMIITQIWGAVELLVDGKLVFASLQSTGQTPRYAVSTGVVIPAGVTLSLQSENAQSGAGFIASGYKFGTGGSDHGWPGPKPQDRFSFSVPVPQTLVGSPEEIAGVLLAERTTRWLMITKVVMSDGIGPAEIRADGTPIWGVSFRDDPYRDHEMNIPFPKGAALSLARPISSSPGPVGIMTLFGYYY